MADPQTVKPNQPDHETRSVSGADFVLFVLLIMVGFGVWAVVERVLTYEFPDWEPKERKVLDAHGVKKQQEELTDTQNEISAVQQSLNATRIDQLKQQAAIESFKAIYPQLSQTNPSADPAAEPLKSFQETRRQELVAKNLIASLEAKLPGLQKRADDLDLQLEKSKEAADRDLQWQRGRYVVKNRLATFAVTLLIVIVLLSLLRWALWRLARKKRMSTEEGFRPFVLALVVLAILFAYDLFNFAGAALVTIVFLLLFLRRIEWPKKAGVLTK